MPQPSLDLDKIHQAVWAAEKLLPYNNHDWLRTYVRDVPALLAELDRLRERVADLEARLDWDLDPRSD